MKAGRFGRSLVDCLNNIKILEENGIRFIAVTQGLDTDLQNPASRFPLHVLGAAAEFELALIRERTQAGRARYKRDFESGKVGRTVCSRSGRNLPPTVPGECSTATRDSGCDAKARHIARSRSLWDWGSGRSSGRCSRVPKARSGHLEQRGRLLPVASSAHDQQTLCDYHFLIWRFASASVSQGVSLS